MNTRVVNFKLDPSNRFRSNLTLNIDGSDVTFGDCIELPAPEYKRFWCVGDDGKFELLPDAYGLVEGDFSFEMLFEFVQLMNECIDLDCEWS